MAQDVFHLELTFSFVVSYTFDRCAWTPSSIRVLRATARAGFSVVAEQEKQENKKHCSCEKRETISRQSAGNPQWTKVRKRGSLPRCQQEEETVPMTTLAVEVEKMKSELFEAEKSLLQDKELASKLSGSCATQARQWENPTKSCPKRYRESVSHGHDGDEKQRYERLQKGQRAEVH